MVGWHHPLNGHEFEQTPADCEGQGSLVCCSPRGCRESDTTEWLPTVLCEVISTVKLVNTSITSQLHFSCAWQEHS